MPDDIHLTGEAAEQVTSATSRPILESSTPIASPNRAELLQRARTFLISPQVRLQDSGAKRAFLLEKGLAPSEVDQLLRELPPAVPPRTYPAPPPSNLPNLLIGVARIFTWLTGTSAITLFVYYRYLLPRLARSYQARNALRNHQSALIARLVESASALKVIQAESYMDIPRAVPTYEDKQYAHYHSIDDLLSHAGGTGEESAHPGADIPDITILRCALEELGCSKTDGISAEELFRHLQSKLPWLGREDGATRQRELWNQLNGCPLFVSSSPKPSRLLLPDHSSQLLWKYIPPPLQPTHPLLAVLENLQVALPQVPSKDSSSPLLISTVTARQRTLQILSDFTGYITTQTYSLGLSSTRGTTAASGGDSAEDEVRREIKALKGLVLNRRSFLPSVFGVSGFTNEPPRS